jgi:O-antigen/teichoic acid export membrane protein
VLFVVQAPQDEQTEYRIISAVIIQLLSSIVFFFYFAKKAGIWFSTLKWKETLMFQLPLIPYYFSMNALLSADRIMIKKMIGSAEAGIYSVAYSAGQIMTILKMCIIDALRPWIYDKLNKKEYSSMAKTTSDLMILVTFLSFVFSALAPEAIKIMASTAYYDAIYVVPPVALSSLFTFTYQLFVIVETYYEKSANIMIASVLAAVINIALNYLMIPVWGYVAAGYTTLFSYMILSVLHYRVVKKIQEDIPEAIDMFNIKSVINISIIGMISCVCVSVLYKFVWIRYGVLLTMLVIMIIFRNHIKALYKNLQGE